MMDADSPFDLDNPAAYQAWQETRLAGYPRRIEDLIVEINDPRALSMPEREAILDRCRRSGTAVYISNTGEDPDKNIPLQLGKQLGLHRLDCNTGADDDGITSLQVAEDQWHTRFIPYSNRPIHWHTDGYYNDAAQQIHALLLHCVRPAADGGTNAVLDHEIAYIRLRELNPDFIRALMAPDAMTIPANVEQGTEVRPARRGPVFSISADGRLHMRYTARTRSIEWKKDPDTRAAAGALESLLASDDPLIYRVTLQSGWGLISNNVLHDRSGFTDDESRPRLLYRLRYPDRIRTT